MRLFITLFLLFFSNLFFNLAQANPHSAAVLPRKTGVETANKAIEESKKSKVAKNTKKGTAPTHDKKPEKTAKTAPAKTTATHDKNVKPHNDKKPVTTTASAHATGKKPTPGKSVQAKAPAGKTTKKDTPTQAKIGHKTHETVIAKTASRKGKPTVADEETATVSPRGKGKKGKQDKASLTISAAHQKRYQHAKLAAMNKLMSQIGKPYHWGGATPYSGFDCSGLVYYAYKDVVKIPIPRTANEMFHLRDAAPIKKSELESGDLVFFRITNRGAADHVGVYLGNGRFIQSPRSGADIKISKLSEDYWQDHYVGARRVVTPKTMR
ncbi:C40 family peptidase [Dickeya solani]|uniref:NlpC/P60 family protein n=1 Tax=Dickeya solani TaxID=1089444 RepID=A0ABU4EGH6_9GAMM|nr:C40 family peptidase [Dickeya solani]MCA6999277.1 NlpC/P60 family protein [Dickeya solani]MCZ0820459.1 NlpC/P60 family protein [Dickeya solani]MDV6996009.1 NlpC/P60 family protein [Dickeya solani]MDV7005596.1 NlpC/P60 family protein [Dickeya solani]MDV7037364.1 NlpC/P60 family protein [Dickeya solani]